MHDIATMGIGSEEVLDSDQEGPRKFWNSGSNLKNGSFPVDQQSSNSIPEDKSPARSHDLMLAAQIALLFMPPFLYARLRVLTDALQRVLSNHSILAAELLDGMDEADLTENNTFERTLELVRFSVLCEVCLTFRVFCLVLFS